MRQCLGVPLRSSAWGTGGFADLSGTWSWRRLARKAPNCAQTWSSGAATTSQAAAQAVTA